MGHPSDRVLNKVLSMCNLPKILNEKAEFYEACQYGKSHLLPFTLSTSYSTEPLALVHTDLWGPSPILSQSSFRFYILFVDDYRRYTWLYPLKNKSDAH